MEKNNLPMVATQRGLDFTNPAMLEAAQRSCGYLVESDLVPPQYSAAKSGQKKAVANCLIAIDYANRLGVSPLAMMQELAIVNGHPSLSSKFLTATINSCGRFEAINYEKGEQTGGVRTKDGKQVIGINGQPLKNMWCYAYTWEKGLKNLTPEEREKRKLKSAVITMQMAYDEGWYNKGGSKWQTMPSQMLMYRAASFWCRVYAPELSLGMISTEEAQDIGEETDFEILPVDETSAAEQVNDESQYHSAAERIKAENEARAKAMQEASDLFSSQDAEGE